MKLLNVLLAAVILLCLMGCSWDGFENHLGDPWEIVPAECTDSYVLDWREREGDVFAPDNRPIDPIKIENIQVEVFSSIDHTLDIHSHGVDDYWQTSYETDELGTGDCEDMVMLVMIRCLNAGLPEDDMFITVFQRSDAKKHATFCFISEGTIYSDNIPIDVFCEERGFWPLYSFNLHSYWVYYY